MSEYKIVQYEKKTIYFDEEQINKRGKKIVKHLQRLETDEEFFERMASELNGFSAEGWTVDKMNNGVQSYTLQSSIGCEVYSSVYFTYLLTREKK